MSLMALRKSWKKLKSWCFHHWRWLVFVSGALLLFCLGRRSNKDLFRHAQSALKAAELESKAIERKHKTEIKLREKARVKYDKAMEAIEKKHEKNKAELSEAKKKELKKNLKKVKNNPDEIDKLLFEEFGIREAR